MTPWSTSIAHSRVSIVLIYESPTTVSKIASIKFEQLITIYQGKLHQRRTEKNDRCIETTLYSEQGNLISLVSLNSHLSQSDEQQSSQKSFGNYFTDSLE